MRSGWQEKKRVEKVRHTCRRKHDYSNNGASDNYISPHLAKIAQALTMSVMQITKMHN
jgi:hypothetical protein